MKPFIYLIFIAVLLSACGGNDQPAEEIEPTPSAENTEKLLNQLIDPSVLSFSLNDGKKWVISKRENELLSAIKKDIYRSGGKMEEMDIEAYHALALQMQTSISQIEVSNQELSKVIKLLNNQMEFMLGDELTQAQIALINLNTIFEVFPNYFSV